MTMTEGPAQVVERILVAVDGSKESDRAVVLASQMSVAFRAKMTIVHVVEMDEIPTLIAEAGDRVGEERGQLILGSAARIAASFGASPETAMLKGHVAQQVLRYAERLKPHLIVTGGRGLTGAKGVFLGSVSQTISRKAECAVVIAR